MGVSVSESIYDDKFILWDLSFRYVFVDVDFRGFYMLIRWLFFLKVNLFFFFEIFKVWIELFVWWDFFFLLVFMFYVWIVLSYASV